MKKETETKMEKEIRGGYKKKVGEKASGRLANRHTEMKKEIKERGKEWEGKGEREREWREKERADGDKARETKRQMDKEKRKGEKEMKEREGERWIK